MSNEQTYLGRHDFVGMNLRVVVVFGLVVVVFSGFSVVLGVKGSRGLELGFPKSKDRLINLKKMFNLVSDVTSRFFVQRFKSRLGPIATLYFGWLLLA